MNPVASLEETPMKVAPLLLSGLLVLGAGLPAGNAIAHDWGHGYTKHDRYKVPYGHWREHSHRGKQKYRYKHREKYRDKHHWKRDRSYWRPRYSDDSWYGIHLFFGGR
jgi:hypothetical protein